MPFENKIKLFVNQLMKFKVDGYLIPTAIAFVKNEQYLTTVICLNEAPSLKEEYLSPQSQRITYRNENGAVRIHRYFGYKNELMYLSWKPLAEYITKDVEVDDLIALFYSNGKEYIKDEWNGYNELEYHLMIDINWEIFMRGFAQEMMLKAQRHSSASHMYLPLNITAPTNS